METMKVKPWGESQGEFVLINKCDFDEEKHEAFDVAKKEEPAKDSVQPKAEDLSDVSDRALKMRLTKAGVTYADDADRETLETLYLDSVA